MTPDRAGGAPELGSKIGGYRLESLLGQGGMGSVYLARSAEGGLCALKVLSSRLVAEDPSFATRFKREVQYAEALDHPHVLELYEAGETPDGTLYFAMQYVDGPDLGVLLRRDGPLSLSRAVAILGQVADALDCAHASGLVHRDVKPANIIVAEDPGGPQAYLTDFGLSKNPAQDSFALTRMGQLIGTMAYTAPEEILGTEPRDHLVDVYSLGCVLYEALVGAPPFVREREIDVLYAHLGDPRPSATAARPDLPAGIDEVIARAMAVTASQRYPTCAELIAAARALVPDEEQETREEGEAPLPAAAPVAPAPVAGLAGAEAAAPAAPVPDAAGSDALRLVVVSEFRHGLVLDVEDELVLGRLTVLDGALAPDHSISRRHASITRREDGVFVVQDEHSRNGTYVNGERIDGPHVLRTGDELGVGSTVFAVAAPEADMPPPPAAAPVADAVELAVGGEAADTRLALRLEFDPDAQVVTVAIENGARVRIVRRDGAWRVESE